MKTISLEQIMGQVAMRNPGEREFHQAAREVFASVIPVVCANPLYRHMKVLERLVEPERVLMFRVPWLDDMGNVQVNRGFRVDMNSAIGPFHGGLRFHPNTNLSVMKFLAFEQVFKNSLSGLMLGGAQGGSDFDPKGKSEQEVMRFCQSFMTELYRYIGTESDILSGGVGVGAREIGYLFGMYKRLAGAFSGAVTGKGVNWGGSRLRLEAGGYCPVYFLQNMLATLGRELKGLKVCVSGSGNLAQFLAKKILEQGGTLLTLSDSDGTLFAPDGFTDEQLDWIIDLKTQRRGRVSEAVEEFHQLEYLDGQTPWGIPCDVAIPAATQNELYRQDAQDLVKNGVIVVAEAADMPCTPDAVAVFQDSEVLFAPGKAVSAGGVVTSGLEIAQNASHQLWNDSEIDKRLQRIVASIHESCLRYGRDNRGRVDYVRGANVAGFVRVAEAMIDQGVV